MRTPRKVKKVVKWLVVLYISVSMAYFVLQWVQDTPNRGYSSTQTDKVRENMAIKEGPLVVDDNPFHVMPEFISPLVKSDNRTWTFKKRIPCPKLSLAERNSKRYQFTVRCDDRGPRAAYEEAETTNVTSFSFGDRCLSDVIDKYCTDEHPVPNVLHYIWFGKVEVKYHHFLSFMSAVRFMNPCLIVFNGEQLPYGKYWDYFTSLYFRLVHLKRPLVKEVHGKKLSFKEHGADVMRIEAINKYGGLYMDTDTVLLRSVDDLRKFNFTMGHEYPTALGNQFIMGRKGARFLHLWHEAYKRYRQGHWDYNSLYVPFQIAKENPTLIHIESDKFTRPNYHNLRQLFKGNYNWSENYAMHLYIRVYLNQTDEMVVRGLNTTYGSVSRHILLGNKELCL